MWRNEEQQIEAIRCLLRMHFVKKETESWWADDGPTDLALELLESNPLSSGEKILFRSAFDFWNGSGNVTLYDIMNRLDRHLAGTVLTLAEAVNRSATDVDQWIQAHSTFFHRSIAHL